MATALETRGAVVRTAFSAAEALDAIRQSQPDVLLAEIGMPDDDGLSLIRNVRRREREEGVPYLAAIAVTAYASPQHSSDALAGGYDLHVGMPIHPRDLADIEGAHSLRPRDAANR